jgi:hypothetical protein
MLYPRPDDGLFGIPSAKGLLDLTHDALWGFVSSAVALRLWRGQLRAPFDVSEMFSHCFKRQGRTGI